VTTKLILASLILLVSGQVNAALIALEYGSSVDLSAQEASFFINFNEIPDFFTVDSVGRQADGFSYRIDTDGSPYPGDPNQCDPCIDRIIWSIGITPTDLEVRVDGITTPPIGSVPYTLTGAMLRFDVPFALLDDFDGDFSYVLGLTEYGGTTDRMAGHSGNTYDLDNRPSILPPVPIPAAVWLFCPSLIGLVGFGSRRNAA